MHKLRAICLFEADFNWWNKLIFARRMMALAGEKGMIPDDLFARKGSDYVDANMCKTLFSDITKVMHHPASITEGDCSDCFDRSAHPPQAVALQAYGVLPQAVRVMLRLLQLMQFCLCTGFGESEERYGGVEDDPLFGLGQGNGTASSGFSALSSLVVNA